MEINLTVDCDRASREVSQAGLLLDALENYRHDVQGGDMYSDTLAVLRLLNDLTEQIARETLKALENRNDAAE